MFIMNAKNNRNAWKNHIKYTFHTSVVLFIIDTQNKPNMKPIVWAPANRYPVAEP